ncbi:flavodoxin family protein [Clostridia bacterium]|nr:flavodoxin family protein [Clostridia bacterium]
MYLVITSSPNANGLTAACGQAAVNGLKSAGAEVGLYDLCAEKISGCLVCGNGWGTCREEHKCVIDDSLADFQERLSKAEGVFIITPVYWGQQSEKMKAFCDRLRRCEALKREKSVLAGKKISLVAAAGGSGNGTVTCLLELEAWCRHVGAIPTERIGITRFNREPMLKVIEYTAAQLAAK